MVWPEGFLRVIDGAAAVMIGSRDAQLRPRAARGSLVRRGAADDELVVYALPAIAANVLPNLRANGAIAIMVSLTASHETYQVKGQVTAIVEAPADDEDMLRARLAMFTEDGARMGIPRRLIERVAHWPALMLTVKVNELFHQSPGPRAGERVRS